MIKGNIRPPGWKLKILTRSQETWQTWQAKILNLILKVTRKWKEPLLSLEENKIKQRNSRERTCFTTSEEFLFSYSNRNSLVSTQRKTEKPVGWNIKFRNRPTEIYTPNLGWHCGAGGKQTQKKHST